MRNWGVVITAFYAVVVSFLFTYGVALLAEPDAIGSQNFRIFAESVITWVPILIILGAQILLVFLSVDSSWRRLKPQRHLMVTVSLVGFLVAILTVAIVFVIGVAYSGDDFEAVAWIKELPENLQLAAIFASPILIWAFWAGLFYAFSRRASNIVDTAVSWLIMGSVLELLIAVPCHIIVRQRDECSAPMYSAYGIATGIAIMLLAFGPGVLFLYRRKLGDYKDNQ